VFDSYHRGEEYKHLAKALLVWLQEDVRNKYRSNPSFSTYNWKIDFSTCILWRIRFENSSSDPALFHRLDPSKRLFGSISS
jgi:hypothetical protein